MQRLKRHFLVLIVFAAAIVGLAKLALTSDFAANEAKARIQAAIGAPVHAQEVALGFSGSAFRGVRVCETAPAAETSAWTEIGACDADVSLWQILTNDIGNGAVTLRDVAVTLAFDAENRLTTRLPAPPAEPAAAMPVVRIENGAFTLRQYGRPDEVFHNINLVLRTEGEKQTLSGTIDDPAWGKWIVSGGQATAAEPFALVLKTAKEMRVTMPLLRRAPFVAPSTWQSVECEGDTNCEVTLRFGGDRVKYRVDLRPHDTKVYVPSIDFRADTALGQVMVEDDVLTLAGVRGTTSGGEVRLGSTMDFRNPASILRFALETSGLNPRLMPQSWRVPAMQGQIDGKADLELTLRDGALVGTRGQGQGTLRMFPFLRPLTLYLESDGRGFRFGLGRG